MNRRSRELTPLLDVAAAQITDIPGFDRVIAQIQERLAGDPTRIIAWAFVLVANDRL